MSIYDNHDINYVRQLLYYYFMTSKRPTECQYHELIDAIMDKNTFEGDVNLHCHSIQNLSALTYPDANCNQPLFIHNDVVMRNLTADNVNILNYEISGFEVTGELSIQSNITVSGIGLYLDNLYVSGFIVTPCGDSSDWCSVFSTVQENSANWNSAYTTLISTSGNWNSAYTALTSTSGNWDSTYTTLTSTSGNWNSAYTTLTSTSGNWNSAYEVVTGAPWNRFVPLSGYATVTGPLTTQSIDLSGGSLFNVGNSSIIFKSGAKLQSDDTRRIKFDSYSFSENPTCSAFGEYSHAEGSGTLAWGTVSHAEGLNTIAAGPYSRVAGINLLATGEYNRVEGAESMVGVPVPFVSFDYNTGVFDFGGPIGFAIQVGDRIFGYSEGFLGEISLGVIPFHAVVKTVDLLSGILSIEDDGQWGNIYDTGCIFEPFDNGVQYSYAGGRRAICQHQLSWLWNSGIDEFEYTTKAGQFKVVAYGGLFFKGDTTVNGNLSSDGLISSSCGNSDQWCSSYTTLTANSGNWGSTYTTVNGASARWDSAYTTLTANSGNWDSAFTSVNNTSAEWSQAYTWGNHVTASSNVYEITATGVPLTAYIDPANGPVQGLLVGADMTIHALPSPLSSQYHLVTLLVDMPVEYEVSWSDGALYALSFPSGMTTQSIISVSGTNAFMFEYRWGETLPIAHIVDNPEDW